MKFNIGDKVAFAQSVLKRMGHDKQQADARGIVVGVMSGGKVVSVDWGGTWLPHEDGGTVRTLPAANLTKILSSGAVFGD